MEIKTCEQYVLAELERTKEELAAVKRYNAELGEERSQLYRDLQFWLKKWKLLASVDGDLYFTFDSIWFKYEEDEFLEFLRILNRNEMLTEEVKQKIDECLRENGVTLGGRTNTVTE